MAEVKMPHPGHEEHLCLLQNTGYIKENFADSPVTSKRILQTIKTL
jgi:hypothetical protein